MIYRRDFEQWACSMTNKQVVGEGSLECRESIRLVLPARPTLNLSATIEQAEPNALPSWRGHVVAPWFFEGYREFAIRPVAADRVLFTHLKDIHGLFAPAFSLLMGAPVQKSHHALNQALRARAEASDAYL